MLKVYACSFVLRNPGRAYDAKDEARPSTHYVCGGNEGEQQLPGHSEEVHDVIHASRALFLSALFALFFVIVVSARRHCQRFLCHGVGNIDDVIRFTL